MTDQKLALVTGASRGIGAATAEALAARGYHVVLTARTTAGLEEVEERIFARGGSATIAPLDLTQGESIGKLATAVAERWGRLDLLVLNAATLGDLGPVAQIDQKDFARVLTLNLTAQTALIGAFDPLLRKAEAPKVIGVTSSVGRTPRAYWGPYGATKAAFEHLLLTYAEENENVGRVAVALLDPGATRTAMRARAFPGEDPARLKGAEVVGDAIARLASEGFVPGHFERVNSA